MNGLLCEQRGRPQPKGQQQQQLLFKHQPSGDSRSFPSDERQGDVRRKREEDRRRREMERMSKSQRAKMLRMQREERRLLRPERSMNAQESEEMNEYIRGEDGIITQTWNNTLAYHRFVEDQLYGLRNILPLMVGREIWAVDGFTYVGKRKSADAHI